MENAHSLILLMLALTLVAVAARGIDPIIWTVGAERAMRSSSPFGVIAYPQLNTAAPHSPPSVAPQNAKGHPELGFDTLFTRNLPQSLFQFWFQADTRDLHFRSVTPFACIHNRTS
jgi:hypothetical protein